MKLLTAATPREAAEFIMRLCGGKPDLKAVAHNFHSQALMMRHYAKRAAQLGGTYQGYTEARALELAKRADEYQVSVPAALADMTTP